MTDARCPTCGGRVDSTQRGGPRRIYCSPACAPRKRGTPSPERLLARCTTPLLQDATRCALTRAEAHGWSPATVWGVARGLALVLHTHRDVDVPVPLTAVRRLLKPHRHSSATRVAEVLDDLGLLADDTTPAIRSWIERRTAELPAGFGPEVHAWLLTMLDGDRRSRSRSHTTLYVHYGAVRPIIEEFAATRDRLREVTRADVDAALMPLRAHPRYNAIAALRSLFRLAKRRGLVFTDPTRHLAGAGRGVTRSLLPMTDVEISAVRDAITHPAQRLVVALAAAHAARSHAIRALTLDEVDLSGRSIVLAGHEQRLADLTRDALLTWLRHRRGHWPHTANRHVLLSRMTALGTGPVTNDYLAGLLGDRIDLERIRQDRILHEALISGADPLRLALVFGISNRTAMIYADLARRVLSDAEPTASTHPESPSDRRFGADDLQSG